MSLYWYAKSAAGMPLLRFLAWIKAVLKDPAFRSDKDTDIAKIIAAIHSGRPGGGYDERSQLRATINECVSPDHLRDFITENEDRKKFLSAKAKGLTEKAIPVNSPGADLRNDVAERIYEIRCKIVHTKGDGSEFELLLPFSKEAELLYHDIDLVEFLAKQVLISTSTRLSLPVDAQPAGS